MWVSTNSVSVPVNCGKLCPGAWQQVILKDFDNRSRLRSLVVQVLGKEFGDQVHGNESSRI
ncbi:MAG: YjbQ family protein [Deltaproteobacteria bacterium]|nr:YjbQ family protein [Deltaproteobacteria bacterium]